MGIDLEEYRNRYGRNPRGAGPSNKGRDASTAPGANRGFQINFDVNKLIDAIADVHIKAEAAVRPAAQAGAQVLYDAALSNIDSMLGKTQPMRGVLREAMYQAYKDKESSDTLASYRVAWNKQKAPHGHLVEYGHRTPYVIYFGKDGRFHTMVKPSMRAMYAQRMASKKPISKSEAEKFFVKRKKGRFQVAARPFLRKAGDQFDKAISAAQTTFFSIINGKTPVTK